MLNWFLTCSDLVVLQTTIVVLKMSLRQLITHDALLAWHRVRLANWLAAGGEEWAGHFRRYNSGTYNNQYMILDLGRVELERAVYDGALWVVEQIPG